SLGIARQRRLLLLGHDPVFDRRHLRRRHGARNAARMPGAARLLREGQGAQAHRDRRRHGALWRAVARLGDRRRGVGRGPRSVWAEPALAAAARSGVARSTKAAAWVLETTCLMDPRDLYGLPLERFTEERNALVKSLRR